MPSSGHDLQGCDAWIALSVKRKFVRRQEARGAALAEEAAEVKGQRSELAGREAELARRLQEHADAAAECRVGSFCTPSACELHEGSNRPHVDRRAAGHAAAATEPAAEMSGGSPQQARWLLVHTETYRLWRTGGVRGYDFYLSCRSIRFACR